MSQKTWIAPHAAFDRCHVVRCSSPKPPKSTILYTSMQMRLARHGVVSLMQSSTPLCRFANSQNDQLSLCSEKTKTKRESAHVMSQEALTSEQNDSSKNGTGGRWRHANEWEGLRILETEIVARLPECRPLEHHYFAKCLP